MSLFECIIMHNPFRTWFDKGVNTDRVDIVYKQGYRVALENLYKTKDSRCGLKSLTWDGCQFCNKDLHIKTMEDTIKGLEAELKEALTRPSNIRRLGGDRLLSLYEEFGEKVGMMISDDYIITNVDDFSEALMDACNIQKEGEL